MHWSSAQALGGGQEGAVDHHLRVRWRRPPHDERAREKGRAGEAGEVLDGAQRVAEGARDALHLLARDGHDGQLGSGSLERARVAVVGTGGAARAVLAALESQGTVRFVVGRNAERAAALGVEFGATPIGVDDIRSARLDVLVNATPVGTLGGDEDASPVPADALRGVSLVYDLVYNPPETLLIKDAVRAGCRTMNGLEMLETQAALQFALWTGVPNKLGAPSRAR